MLSPFTIGKSEEEFVMNNRYLLSLALVCTLGVAFASQTLAGPGTMGVQMSVGTAADITRLVGEQVCFTLTARDDNGNVIRSWDQIGSPTTLTLRNSMANTDSSTRSWNADPEGYTWARLLFNGSELTKITDNEWSIPHTAFVNGEAVVCLIHTRADTGVFVEVSPPVPFLNQVSQSITFIADEITNYLVDLTSADTLEDAVYVMRPYEIIVAPRDRFMNISEKEIKTRFSARFPGEFDASDPGLADIFAGDVFIQGLTNYLIASRIERMKPVEPQVIIAFASDDQTIRGETDPYEIREHAPVPFALLTPTDHAVLNLDSSATQETFTWERPTPQDPYTDIQVSRFNPAVFSDAVQYTWVIVDSVSLTRATRILSNNGGRDASITLNHGQLWGILQTISGLPSTRQQQCLWYVEASDGLYTTRSSPFPGHYLSLIADGITSNKPIAQPTAVALEQNYPNPFNPSTSITFTTTRSGWVRLRVFNLLGKDVATLVNRNLDAGVHNVTFDARGLRSGVYMYQLEAEGRTMARRMLLSK